MTVGWLFYTEEDANKNLTFINELIHEARAQRIDLTLKFEHEFNIQDLTNVDFVWNRTRNDELALYFEQQNIKVFNNHYVNKLANNKWLTYQFAKKLNIPCIPTWDTLPDSLTFPVVVKSVEGHGGQEVALCHSLQEVNHYINLFGKNSSIIQPFMPSNNQDIRIWMLGEQILGSVLRTGKESFKSNYTLGGTIEHFHIPEELKCYLKKIVHELKSDYIGIDFIKSNNVFYLNEMEDPVGARSFYHLYDVNLPHLLISYINNTRT
ncbi:ribosomal protein S6--L-glutamate ligase [Ureibacillus xyleni]|uniref:Ribosomal protein S6--L-glutamate ligase n=1 Tax=Ureibacillus xyleni TaxID=614648 RepID=A0A285S6Y0_9BACL|nr:ATP-grasp domain-containing protein [Ureibacillus xyleni]SOC02591.1 ribosomal protein S6--L-glutamate ligase [Ureibacillus xyleni]